MIYFLIIFLILAIITTIFAFSLIIGLIQTNGVPFLSTPPKKVSKILEVAKINSGDIIYDLGCGKASLLIEASKKYNAKGIGYELSLFPYLWAKFSIFINKANVKVYRKNFFQADLSNADIVFCYLFSHIMIKLESKFEKELKTNAKVLSYSFQLPNINPVETVITNPKKPKQNKIYIYKF